MLEFARESSLELKNPKSGTIDMVESIAIADDGAIMSIPCRRNGETYLVTTVKVGTPGEDSEGSTGQRKAIEEFLRFYIPELVKLKCGG
ncbi:hypothetical protein [Streptomyces sp. NPDC006274]|uniref:hypothetical protein n=1 Tax=Streptomyces sp. NPDC006274 TaxID=3154582 RepID=UPI0033A1D0F1